MKHNCTRYVIFDKGKQNFFLKEVKSLTKLTWDQMAELLKINRSMIYFYLNESSKLPYDFYVKLSKKSHLKVKRIKTVEMCKKEIDIVFPVVINEKLSELLGILSGDGCISKLKYEICVTCSNVLDRQYVIEHVTPLFENIFAIRPKIRVQGNRIRCKIYSKKLASFLSEELNFPIGKKKGKLIIPSYIYRNENLLKMFLRGVFDTDGSFHRHHKNTAAIEFISCDFRFRNQLKQSLKKIGFNVPASGKSIYIYKKEDIQRFFDTIKPENEKHLIKYDYYKSFGTVPILRR